MLSTFYRSRSSFVAQSIPGEPAWINGRHRRNTGSYMHAKLRHIAALSTHGLLSCSPSDRLDVAVHYAGIVWKNVSRVLMRSRFSGAPHCVFADLQGAE